MMRPRPTTLPTVFEGDSPSVLMAKINDSIVALNKRINAVEQDVSRVGGNTRNFSRLSFESQQNIDTLFGLKNQQVLYGGLLGTIAQSANFTWNNTTALLTITGTLNVVTGYQYNSLATSGHYLRGNGTNIVLSAIQLSDLPAHNVLSATHGDTTAASVIRGDIISGQGTSAKWSRLAISVPAATFMNYIGTANGDTEPGYKALFDATVPTTIAESAAAAAGTATVAARRDHTHGAPATWAPTAHNLLSTSHGDTSADNVVRGDIIIGNSTPAWSRLAKGTEGYYLRSGADDAAWSAVLAGDLPAHGVTVGTLPKSASANGWADSVLSEAGGHILIAGAGRYQCRDANTYISSENANYLDFTAATGFRMWHGATREALLASEIIYLGNDAGTSATGARCIGIGGLSAGAGAAGMSGADNLCVGYEAGYNLTSGIACCYLGRGAGYGNAAGATGSGNFGAGYQALYSLTSGHSNFAGGYRALYSLTTGLYNWAGGYESGYSQVSGSYNVYAGYLAGWAQSSENANVAIGGYAMYTNVSAPRMVCIGYEAGYNARGQGTVAIGYRTIYNAASTGEYNAVVGYASGYLLTSGEMNAFFGGASGYRITTGSYNTMLGRGAGLDAAQLATAQNSMALGYSTYTTKNNQIVIGNTSVVETILRAELYIMDGAIERWRVTSAGILQSNGAQTIQTSTGNLTIATAAGNGHILLSPHGTGNVSIGVAAPVNVLDIERNQSAGTLCQIKNDTANYYSGYACVTNANAGYLLAFDDGYVAVSEFTDKVTLRATSCAALALLAEDAAGEIHLYTGGYAAANKRVTVDASGSCGVGIAPSYKLHIYNSTTQVGLYAYTVYTGADAYGAYGAALGANTGFANFGMYAAAKNGTTNYAIYVPNTYPAAGANNYQLYLASDAKSYFGGNVGIGTTTPGCLFHAYKTQAADTIARIENHDGSGSAVLELKGNGSALQLRSDSFNNMSELAWANDHLRIRQRGCDNYIKISRNAVSGFHTISTDGTVAEDIGFYGGANLIAYMDVSAVRWGFKTNAPDEVVHIASGNLKVENGNTFSGSVDIDDDDFDTITPGKIHGIITISCQTSSIGAVIAYVCDDPASIQILAQNASSFEVTTGALDGTTGTDGKFTISAHTDGKIYLENRLGGT